MTIKYLNHDGLEHLIKRIDDNYSTYDITDDEIDSLFGQLFEIRIFNIKTDENYCEIARLKFENFDFVSATPYAFSDASNQTSSLEFTDTETNKTVTATLSVSKMATSGVGDDVRQAFMTTGGSTFSLVSVASNYPTGNSPYGGVYCQQGNADATGFDFVIRFNKAFEKDFMSFSMATKAGSNTAYNQQQKFRIELYSYTVDNGNRSYTLLNTCTWTKSNQDTGNYLKVDFSKGNQTLISGSDHY